MGREWGVRDQAEGRTTTSIILLIMSLNCPRTRHLACKLMRLRQEALLALLALLAWTACGRRHACMCWRREMGSARAWGRCCIAEDTPPSPHAQARRTLQVAGIASHASCLRRQASMSMCSWAHLKATRKCPLVACTRRIRCDLDRFQFSNLPTLFFTARSRPSCACPKHFLPSVFWGGGAPPAGVEARTCTRRDPPDVARNTSSSHGLATFSSSCSSTKGPKTTWL